MQTSDLDRDDLAERIEAARQAVVDVPGPESQHNLAVLLLESYERHGSAAAVAEAVEVIRQAIAASTAAGTDGNGPRGLLGAALTRQHEIDGDSAALDEAIDVLRAVVREAPQDPVSGTDHRIQLGVALEARVWETGSAEDADAAVALARSVLADTPVETVDYLVIRSNLSNALLTQYEVAGGPGQLDEAVTHARAVADAFPASDPRRASMFANLSGALRMAFDESGKGADLDDAVDAAHMGVRLAEDGDPGLPGYLVNLANGLHTLSEARGDAGTAEEALTAARRAVAAWGPDGARRSVPLACLGNCLRGRYEMTGELAVLDEAIATDQAALDATSPQDPDQARCLSSLAEGLTLRHEAEPDLGVLDMALEYARAGAAAASEDDPDRYRSLLTWARTEYVKFLTTADRDALDRSIEADRQAGQLVDAGSPGRAIALANLAASLIVRGRPTGGSGGHLDSAALDPADFEEAASLLAEAVALTPADSPDRALYLYNLGEARASLARAGAGAAADAADAFRAAAAIETASPMLRAEAAMEWGRNRAAHGDWAAAAEGFSLAVSLSPLISPRHFDRDDQERRLATFAGLASDAAACVLAASEGGSHDDRAHRDRPGPTDSSLGLRPLTLLEQGRGMLVGYLLGDSADLSRVRAVAPELAAEFERLRDEIDAVGAGQLTGPLWPARARTAGVLDRPDPAIRRRELLSARDTVAERIRAIDGLAGFLRAPDADQLLAAGSEGPFVLVNISRYRCDAIAIRDGRVQVVRLPGVTSAGVAEVTARYLRLFSRLRRLGQLTTAQRRSTSNALRDISGWLWDLIARPVLDGLGLPRHDGEVPRLWWCPTGSLALLPLHAAHRYDPERGTDAGVADWTVSSYAVSIRTLLALRDRSRAPVAGAGQLVVALDRTPGQRDLPQVAQEVAVVGAAAGPAPLILRNEAATRDAVRAGLARHPWFHFAGHSRQDLLHPGRARLYLGDGDLDALTIAGQRLAGGELAYLSCCEGAVPGTEVPDEPLHLALAFQIAGYRNVIATMWSVGDLGAAEVARGIYQRLRRDGNTDRDDAARALREVVIELRDRYPYEIWASYLHAGV
jgi:tetratricopeptide (TPR) repeat protein